MVISRTAHVIGAPRRRKVYHATDTGREEAAKSTPPENKRRGRSVGPIPDQILLHGREDFVERFHRASPRVPAFCWRGFQGLASPPSPFPMAESLLDEGWLVRWATFPGRLRPLLDSRNVVRGRTPSSKEAISARADSKKTLLVLDEAQQSSGGTRTPSRRCSKHALGPRVPC
ncbi:MAG: hypothetical protein Ct9H90mP21_2030 [Methanobacteriota archaeon]|nr:MAG: hypothetical protein Ct9H90mP21_2030 [Euryarchaeota archaeon]